MDATNIAVLRGTVSSEPRRRELTSGAIVTQVEVTTRGSTTSSVPVAVFDREVTVVAGDDVLVVGRVHRRFFRAGGVTQSRTEVVADRLVPARHRRRVERAVAAAVEQLGGASSPLDP